MVKLNSRCPVPSLNIKLNAAQVSIGRSLKVACQSSHLILVAPHSFTVKDPHDHTGCSLNIKLNSAQVISHLSTNAPTHTQISVCVGVRVCACKFSRIFDP